MKHLYLDLSAGVSGDMFVGALLDLGVSADDLRRQLRQLPVDGYRIHAEARLKGAIRGTKFNVHLSSETHCPESTTEDHRHADGHSHPHTHTHSPEADAHDHVHGRDHAQIRALIEASGLSNWVRDRSLKVFQRIAIAEGKIHGVPPDRVQFHEVGAVDSIVDIVGACIALELLGCPRISASRVMEGTGFVRCAHGRMPLPAAATLEILGKQGIAITQCEEPHEMVTPTGAALVAEFSESFGPMDGVTGARVGYGLGTREHRTRPNVLRAILWESSTGSVPAELEADQIMVLEANIDDMNPELLGAVLEKALRAGALDAFHTPIQMKKQRPGTLFTLIVPAEKADEFTEFLLLETTTFGVRRNLMERRKLKREMDLVRTEFGSVQVKLGRMGDRIVQASPEFESCRSVAAMAGVPVRYVYLAAIAASATRVAP
jgi:pyridinium-3,5-bisthiocarboxylic acid mononucleotide nickel chelatase